MTVHRLSLYRSDDPYTRVPNVTVNDDRLDLKARGLLLFMLSKPDGWLFRERTLALHLKVSRAQIRTAIDTLMTTGYVRRVTTMVDGVPRIETQVYDVAQHDGTVSVPAPVPNPDRPEPVPVSNTERAVKTNQRAKRQPDVVFDAVAQVCGHDIDRLTAAERGRINRACKDLRTVEASPDQIRLAASRWKQIYPNATLTPTAIAAHWSRLTASSNSGKAPEIDPELERIRNEQRGKW